MISDHIMKRRIAESQSLIMQGIPLIDVAYQVGFGSLSTFIRAFRSVTNMTPSEYRKLRKEISFKKIRIRHTSFMVCRILTKLSFRVRP